VSINQLKLQKKKNYINKSAKLQDVWEI